MREPHTFNKKILIAVTGLSPQIITETLYGLIHQNNPFIPTDIYVITTKLGEQRIKLELLSSSPGWYSKFIEEYELPPINFNENNIFLLKNQDNKPLNDIQTLEDNAIIADFITNTIRKLTEDEDSAIHASIAGGRKTMGFYLGYALSLYGRSQDRLSHVLVSPQYEKLSNFFYPTIKSNIIYANDANHTPMDCKHAEVSLAEIPLVSLRKGLPKKLQTGNASYMQIVESANLLLKSPRLEINYTNRCIIAYDEVFILPSSEFAFYALFVERADAGREAVRKPMDNQTQAEYKLIAESLKEEFLEIYKLIKGHMADTERTEEALQFYMNKSFFEAKVSKVNKYFIDCLDEHLARPFLIANIKRGSGQYRINVNSEDIYIIRE